MSDRRLIGPDGRPFVAADQVAVVVAWSGVCVNCRRETTWEIAGSVEFFKRHHLSVWHMEGVEAGTAHIVLADGSRPVAARPVAIGKIQRENAGGARRGRRVN